MRTYPRTWLRPTRALARDLDALLTNIRRNARKGIQLGAGHNLIPGLVNCDLFNPAADVKADACDLHIFADGEVDLLETHHMIEHLSLEATDRALREWYRVLAPNGLLVITFPDFTAIARRWLRYAWTYWFRPRPARIDYLVKMIVGSQENDGMYHRNVFDRHRMRRLLAAHGFRIEFTAIPYPRRPTPSRLVVAAKTAGGG